MNRGVTVTRFIYAFQFNDQPSNLDQLVVAVFETRMPRA